MELTITVKDYLEIIYFITGGPILAIIGLFALYQIKVMKKQLKQDEEILKTNSKRESIKLSVEQCTYFSTTIMEQIDKTDILFIQKGFIKIDDNNDKLIEISDNNIILKIDKNDFYKMNKRLFNNIDINNPETISKLVEIQELSKLKHLLESFATFFISKIADERVAFNTIGEEFVTTVTRYIIYILNSNSINNTTNNKSITNVIQLYILWHNRIESEQLITELKKDKEKIQQKEEIINKSNKKTIKPIGT